MRALAVALVLAGCSSNPPEPPPLPPLSTVSGSGRLPGKFVWADLVTDNAAAARKFYSTMFGWAFEDYGDYVVGKNQDRPLCGIIQRPRPEDRTAEPRWFGYISVKSVGRAGRAATEAGGRMLLKPEDMPDRGEQAVFADPEGAVFGVVRSSSGDPEDFLADPGDWIWIQLLSRDGRKAAEFYRTVAGYTIVENTESNRVNDYILTSEGYARATVRNIRSADPKVQPTWLPFVRVKDVTESIALAKQAGGKVLIEPRPDVLQGKAAVIADPTGAAIGIMEWHEDFAKEKD
jgi:predicted enzyme related to lactoylglutathione lyase